MATKKGKKGSDNRKGGRKKYAKPKLVRHGNLETVAERITGAVALPCCVSERVRSARVESAARSSLLADLSRTHASTR
jgi:hypothetical protein